MKLYPLLGSGWAPDINFRDVPSFIWNNTRAAL
jgi:hypothetical protein